jgi:maltose alpha-D-glucosyltransferase/alpha-amylase
MAASETTVNVTSAERWQQLFNPEVLPRIETALPDFIRRQRWFGSKSRVIHATSVIDWGTLNRQQASLALVKVSYEIGGDDTYLLPLAIAPAEEAAIQPDAIVTVITLAHGKAVVYDALRNTQAANALLAIIGEAAQVKMGQGEAKGRPSSIFSALRGDSAELPARLVGTEQSNSSIIYGSKLIMKLFRKQATGINPDIEIGRYLTEQGSFHNIAPFGGSIEYRNKGGDYAFAMLQGLVANLGDGWEWTHTQLEAYYDAVSAKAFPSQEAAGLPNDFESLSKITIPAIIRDAIGSYLEAASTLGQRTAEMHAALGAETDNEAFTPQPFSSADTRALREHLVANANRAFEALNQTLPSLPGDAMDSARLALSRRDQIIHQLNRQTSGHLGGQQIRVHGDYHLGQLLRTESDFMILDFEGEPARTIEERRAKQSPLKDVAGMLRSFSYAAFASLTRYSTRRSVDPATLEPWSHLWEKAVFAEFLRAYRKVLEGSPILPGQTDFQPMLEAFVLDKAIYELIYELNNRPTWVRVPLHGILSLSK